MRKTSVRHVMWGIRIIGIFCLVVVLIVFGIFAVNATRRPGLGSMWVFDVSRTSGTSYTETETISSIELCGLQVCVVFTSESPVAKTMEWITADWVLMKIVYVDDEGNSQIDTYRDGVRLYKLPLQVGDSWVWDTVATRTTILQEPDRRTPTIKTQDLNVYGLRKVVGIEKVTVPAGEYSAFVIDHFDQNEVIRQKLWFSVDAGEAIKYVNGFFGIYRTVWELKQQDPKQASLLEFFEFNTGALKLLPLLIVGVVLVAAPSLPRKLR